MHLDQSDPLLTSYLDKLPDLIRILDFHRCASIFTATIRAQSSQDSGKKACCKRQAIRACTPDLHLQPKQIEPEGSRQESNFQLMMELATFIDRNLDKEITLSFPFTESKPQPYLLYKLFKRYLGKRPISIFRKKDGSSESSASFHQPHCHRDRLQDWIQFPSLFQLLLQK